MTATKVRLTIFGPDREHECDDSEIPDLRAQGLLIEDEPAAAPATKTPTAKTTKDGA